MKKFVAKVSKVESQVWYVVIPVPDKISQEIIKQGDKRIICTINETETFHAALMPDGQKSFFILLNKERRKKLNLDLGDEINITIKKDDSKYGMPMPEEMEELLYQDPEGDQVFHQLTIGKQRSLLHLIGKPKSSNIRLNKALTVINYLKSTEGQLDFKELNEAFKANKF